MKNREMGEGLLRTRISSIPEVLRYWTTGVLMSSGFHLMRVILTQRRTVICFEKGITLCFRRI